MAERKEAIDELVDANHILASEGVCDSFGHVSVRRRGRTATFLLSRARAPELIERGDIMEFALDGTPVGDDDRQPYLERFIHAAIYAQRDDVEAIVHSHSRNVIPFSVTPARLKPLLHNCAVIGEEVPVWDSRRKFGDTRLLVADMAMGDDLAETLGACPCALMRGHGSTVVGTSIREAVYTAIYLDLNAQLQMSAGALGPITFLSPGEIEQVRSHLGVAGRGIGYDRAWEHWLRRARARQDGD